MNILNYIYAIGEGFPTVGCHCVGDGSVYANIVWDSGDPIPTQAALDAYITSSTISQMTTLILAERDRRTSTGGYVVGGHWFQSDSASRIQQLSLVVMGANLPPGVQWKTMAGTFVSMTQTLAVQIFQAAAASDVNIFTVAEQKRQAMIASATPATYDYLSGWPLIYGE